MHRLNTVLWAAEKKAALLPVVIKEFENRSQDCQKINTFFFCYICDSIFSQHKYNKYNNNLQIVKSIVQHCNQIFKLKKKK